VTDNNVKHIVRDRPDGTQCAVCEVALSGGRKVLWKPIPQHIWTNIGLYIGMEEPQPPTRTKINDAGVEVTLNVPMDDPEYRVYLTQFDEFWGKARDFIDTNLRIASAEFVEVPEGWEVPPLYRAADPTSDDPATRRLQFINYVVIQTREDEMKLYQIARWGELIAAEEEAAAAANFPSNVGR